MKRVSAEGNTMKDRVVIRDWTKGTDKDYGASQFPLGHNSICMQIVWGIWQGNVQVGARDLKLPGTAQVFVYPTRLFDVPS